MYIDIIWKIVLPALIGLFVIAAVVMNSSAQGRGIAHSSTESRGVTRSAPARSVCSILYPVPCASNQMD
jgi:hypothetical protein